MTRWSQRMNLESWIMDAKEMSKLHNGGLVDTPANEMH
jgi:hypothetical protein